MFLGYKPLNEPWYVGALQVMYPFLLKVHLRSHHLLWISDFAEMGQVNVEEQHVGHCRNVWP